MTWTCATSITERNFFVFAYPQHRFSNRAFHAGSIYNVASRSDLISFVDDRGERRIFPLVLRLWWCPRSFARTNSKVHSTKFERNSIKFYQQKKNAKRNVKRQQTICALVWCLTNRNWKSNEKIPRVTKGVKAAHISQARELRQKSLIIKYQFCLERLMNASWSWLLDEDGEKGLPRRRNVKLAFPKKVIKGMANDSWTVRSMIENSLRKASCCPPLKARLRDSSGFGRRRNEERAETDGV